MSAILTVLGAARRGCLAAITALWLSACVPAIVQGQQSSCRSDPQGGTGWLLEIRRMYGLGDSVAAAAAGYPFATGSAIELETASATCDSAVHAFNRDTGRAGTSDEVTDVLVFRLGPSGYVVHHPAESSNGRAVLRIYSSDWQLKQVVDG